MEGRASGSTASWLTLLQSHPLPSNRGPISHSAPLTSTRPSYHHLSPPGNCSGRVKREIAKYYLNYYSGYAFIFLVPFQSVKYPGNGNFHLLQADGRKLSFRSQARLVDFLLSTRTGAAPFSSKVRTTSRNSPHLYYLVLLFSASPQARICGWTPPSPGKEIQSYYPKNATRSATRPRPGLQISHTLITVKPSDPAIGPQNSGPEIQALTRPPCSQPGPRTLTPAQPLGPRRGPDRNLSCPVHGLVS